MGLGGFGTKGLRPGLDTKSISESLSESLKERTSGRDIELIETELKRQHLPGQGRGFLEMKWPN